MLASSVLEPLLTCCQRHYIIMWCGFELSYRGGVDIMDHGCNNMSWEIVRLMTIQGLQSSMSYYTVMSDRK